MQEAHHVVFHLTEFWGVAVFAVVQVYTALYSPRSFGTIYPSPALLKIVMCLGIVTSAIPALLISIDMERFEPPAHQLEYVNELCMGFIDLVSRLSQRCAYVCFRFVWKALLRDHTNPKRQTRPATRRDSEEAHRRRVTGQIRAL